MDILAQKRMLFVLIQMFTVVFYASAVTASVYGLSRVDYFNKDASLRAEKLLTTPLKFSSDELWAVEMTDNKGITFLQRPPGVVAEFLEDPGRVTGLRYLAWNEARSQQMEQAALVLEQLSLIPSELEKKRVP